jgi:hydroxymethylglutaryl-CoA reductase
MITSRISGLHKMSRHARLAAVSDVAQLPQDTQLTLTRNGPSADLADHLSENVVSTIEVPLGIATNLIVDGEEVLVPMATEESSVVAAVCNGARACRPTGGVRTQADDPVMIAQVQLIDVSDTAAGEAALKARASDIQAICDACDPMLVSLGGGFCGIEPRILDNGMLVLHLHIDVRDAMGANTVNTMAETLAPKLEAWTGGTVGLRILSNLADQRLVRAQARWRPEDIGAETVTGILNAYQFAAADPYRAATHNKGIMNGIDAVALATMNDTRAIEAGAHAYAATRGPGYAPLTRYWQDGPDLVGEIELPLAMGIVGGATKAHPTAQAALQIMRTTSADRLTRVTASVGLIQNFSALRALASEGIQRGHMSLHARNVAIAAGATGDAVDRIARDMIAQKAIREDVARDLLAKT